MAEQLAHDSHATALDLAFDARPEHPDARLIYSAFYERRQSLRSLASALEYARMRGADVVLGALAALDQLGADLINELPNGGSDVSR